MQPSHRLLLPLLACSIPALAQDASDAHGDVPVAQATPRGTSLAASAGMQVIFTNLAGDPTAAVPGQPGVNFQPGIAGALISRVYGSPNGNWVLKVQTDRPVGTDDALISNFVVRAFEADLAPVLGANLGAIRRHCGINDVGQSVFLTNTNGAASADEVVLSFDPAGNLLVAAQEGASVPAIPGGTYAGSLQNPAVLRDGGFGVSGDGFGGTVPGNQNEILLLGNSVLLQQNISMPPGQIGAGLVQQIRPESFCVTPDGGHYAVACDLNSPTGLNQVVVVDGNVVLQEGVSVVSALDPNPVANGVAFAVTLDASGNWYARGSNALTSHDWVVRNGSVIAETGASVDGGSEVWNSATFATGFFLHVGNGVGDWVVGGSTNAAVNSNHVLVLNGSTVVCRENDPVDVDGNGLFDDDTRIANFGGFVNDYAFLSDSGELYFVATLRNDAGSSKGMGFFKIDLDANTQTYCTAGPTSLGEPARIRVSGSISVSADDLVLTASPVPPNSVGLFFYGAGQANVPFGNGVRCVDPGGVGLFRLAGHPTGIGFLEEQLDLAHPVAPLGAITPGSTWNFQAWFRDVAAGGAQFDLSDAVQITFTP